jgi:single-strand DNA-binding protein
MNSVCLVGNLGRDPELRYTPAGKAVCEVSIAIKDGKDETTWVDVTAWEQSAEYLAQYGRKGASMSVQGRLREDKWTDKESGLKRSKIKVTANRVSLIWGRSSEDQRPAASNYGEESQAAPDDADVPF